MKPPMDERSERIAKQFEVPMLIAATLVIPTIIIEEAGPGEPLESLGVVLNWGIWIAFLVEAVVMLWVVPDKWRWVRTHPIEVIVVVIPVGGLGDPLPDGGIFSQLPTGTVQMNFGQHD